MEAEEHLRGSCSCGRYNYVVRIPVDLAERNQAHVHFGTGEFNRQSHASILSAWLRVPLGWYQSATVSLFPDEQHDRIARTFEPLQHPGFQRKFCGYCGTHISYWTEREQAYMNITLGSLRSRDLAALEDLDLLPEDAEDAHPAGPVQAVELNPAIPDQSIVSQTGDGGLLRTSRRGTNGGISWFEDMIEGSQLGYSHKTRRGHEQSADGTTTVTWEVSEYYEGGDQDVPAIQPSMRPKRKADEIGTDDIDMKG